jgi:hypothetical protein
MSRCCVVTTKFPCLQEMPPSDPIEQGDEGDWDTVGEPAGGSRSLAPTIEELLAQLERQPPTAQGSTEPAAAATEEVAAAEAQEEAPAEAGLVDIASILGAPTVMVIRSSLQVFILPEQCIGRGSRTRLTTSLYTPENRQTCPGRGMNPLQRWRKRKSRRPLRSPLPPLKQSPKRRPLRLRCLRPASLKVSTLLRCE